MATQGISAKKEERYEDLALGAAGGGVLQMIPLEAAELAHQMVHQGKGGSGGRKYTPNILLEQYETISVALRRHHS